MIEISYFSTLIFISILWILLRGLLLVKRGYFLWKRELQLILVYICIIVVVRFTFFPFSKINGQIQPLIFDAARILPIRLNLIPLVNLTDYESRREALINLIGNTAMFVPIGIIWPMVFQKLDSHAKVIFAGFLFSLSIEILQLPFFDRVTDIDDLILNVLGYLLGYGIWLAVQKWIKRTSD